MTLPRFAVVGHPNKGKSSIVATLAQDETVRISIEPGTTTRSMSYPMRLDERVLYELIDTPGFQRPRAVLDWMQRHETTADQHPQVAAAFVEAHHGGGQFVDECELLAPIVDGAGILYVVDGSAPYGPEYEAEMEILRWTGRPSMALINPIGRADHVEQWRSALSQFFRMVRVFNPMMAEFDKRIDLLRAFGQLQDDWRQPLDHAADSLQADRARKRRQAARQIAQMLADSVSLRLERKLREGGDEAAERSALEEQFREALRSIERRSREQVQQLYEHRKLERTEATLAVVDDDLFAQRTWRVLGLKRSQLLAMGASGGAVIGGMLDASVGGASFLTGTLFGAGIGAAAGWWSAGQLVKVRIGPMALGGRMLIAGPSRNINLPFVMLGRARLHHLAVARRSHAQRDALLVDERAEKLLPALADVQRKVLNRQFAHLRKGDDSSRSVEQAASVIEDVLRDDEQTATAAAKAESIHPDADAGAGAP